MLQKFNIQTYGKNPTVKQKHLIILHPFSHSILGIIQTTAYRFFFRSIIYSGSVFLSVQNNHCTEL